MADARSYVPKGGIQLAPYDASRSYDGPLADAVRELSLKYLACHAEVGMRSDFDNRFYKALAFLLPFLHKNLSRRPRNVLEVGCGKGAKSIPLALICDDYLGVDINKDEIESARDTAQKLGVRNAKFAVDSAANIGEFLKKSPRRFDLIILYAVIEHLTIEEKLSMMRAVWEYLDDDGIVFIGEAPNRMLPTDYHSTESLYFQQMPFDLWPYYVEHAKRPHWKEALKSAMGRGNWHLAAYRRGVHVGHQEFDLSMMPIEELDRHIVADSYDVNLLNLYGLEYFEFLKLAELRSYRAFHPAVQLTPRDFPDFFSRYYLEALFAKRPVARGRRRVRVSLPFVTDSSRLFETDLALQIDHGAGYRYRPAGGGATLSLCLHLVHPGHRTSFTVKDCRGRLLHQFDAHAILNGIAVWRRQATFQLAPLQRECFPITIEPLEPGKSLKLFAIIESDGPA